MADPDQDAILMAHAIISVIHAHLATGADDEAALAAKCNMDGATFRLAATTPSWWLPQPLGVASTVLWHCGRRASLVLVKEPTDG